MSDYWFNQRYDDAYFALHGCMPEDLQPEGADSADDLPGMWDQSDLTGGEMDATDTRRNEQ